MPSSIHWVIDPLFTCTLGGVPGVVQAPQPWVVFQAFVGRIMIHCQDIIWGWTDKKPWYPASRIPEVALLVQDHFIRQKVHRFGNL